MGDSRTCSKATRGRIGPHTRPSEFDSAETLKNGWALGKKESRARQDRTLDSRGGEGGIRTHGPPCGSHLLSRKARSTELRHLSNSGVTLSATTQVSPYQFAVTVSPPLRCSGERGIRTPGGLHLDGFQDRCNRPLCHLSVDQVSESGDLTASCNSRIHFSTCSDS